VYLPIPGSSLRRVRGMWKPGRDALDAPESMSYPAYVRGMPGDEDVAAPVRLEPRGPGSGVSQPKRLVLYRSTSPARLRLCVGEVIGMPGRSV
jgi:hypothetical protein